jgi:deoxyribose-phosphate aldolase
VIFETDYLSGDEIKIQLCRVCERAGADFVKTSSGYGFVKQADGGYNYRGATEHDLVLMRANCSPRVQVKAAGGVRDLDGLIKVRDLGAARCGRRRRRRFWMNTAGARRRSRPERSATVRRRV